MSNLEQYKLDRTAISVVDLHTKQSDREYWMSKTPGERFAALELLRQINYGYDPATERLQRVLEIGYLHEPTESLKPTE